MGSSKIIITAGLNTIQTTSIITDDLKTVAANLNKARALEIVCHLNETDSFNQLNNELLALSKKLQITPTIKIDVANNGNNANNIISNITENANQAKNAVDNVSSSLRNLSSNYTKNLKVIRDGNKINANATMNEVYNQLGSLGKVSVKGLYDKSGSSQALTGMIATIKNARGEMRTLQYDIRNTMAVLTSSTYDDKGVAKVTQDIYRLEKELATFKQSHSAIESGLTKPMQEAARAIENVKRGTGFVEDARKALDNLKTTAATIGANLKSTGSSFNIFDNAINKANKFSTTLSSLRMDIGNLGTDRKVSLLSDLDKVQDKVQVLKSISRHLGFGEAWSKEYANVSASIQRLTDSLKLAQQQELQQAQTEAERVKIVKQLVDAQQRDYWQGRRKEAIDALTAENTELKRMKQYYEELERAKKAFNSTKTSLGSSINTGLRQIGMQLNNATFRNNAFDTNVKDQLDALDRVKSKYQALQAELQVAKTPEALAIIKTKLEQLAPEFNNAIDSSRRLQAGLRNSSAIQSFDNNVKKLTESMNAYATINKRAVESTKLMSNGKSFAENWASLQQRLASDTLSPDELKHLTEEFAIFGREVRAQGLQGASAWDRFLHSFKAMSTYISANMVFSFVRRQIRNLVNEVRTLDTSMVELRKVTEATSKEFEAFQVRAGKIATTLGATISDVIDATTTFSRAGFNLADAEKLGEIATLYKNVGDGVDIEGASEAIISIMKAFNIEASESERIIDRINNVSNNFAIDSQGLGFALQRVASAMRAANNTLDETIALTTVANEIVQNPEMVSQGWRTVAMRIRGAKVELEEAGEDTEGMVESTAKLRELIKSISGVDIMIDENNFKSTYQIIEELGKVWNNISDINQASLLEAIAGKRQANIVAAALNNYERLDDVLNKSIDSVGSAQREQNEYAKSIQYSLDILKASYQRFAETIVKSDFLKNIFGKAQGFLDILTKIVDKFGLLPTILTSIGAAKAFKGQGMLGNLIDLFKGKSNNGLVIDSNDVRQLRQYNNLLQQGVSTADAESVALSNVSQNALMLARNANGAAVSERVLQQATQQLTFSQRAAAVAARGLSIALNMIGNMLVMGAISLIITGLSKLKDKLTVTKEELAEIRTNAVESMQELAEGMKKLNDDKTSVDSILQKYQELISSTTDVSANKEELAQIQESLVEQFGKEAQSLDLLNDSYDTTIEKVKQLSDAQYKQWQIENADKIAQYEQYSKYNLSLDDIRVAPFSTSGEFERTIKLLDKVNGTAYASLYLIEDVSEKIQDLNVAGTGFFDGMFHNDVLLSGSIEDAYGQLEILIEKLREAGATKDELNPLTARYAELGDIIRNMDLYLTSANTYESEHLSIINQSVTDNINAINNLNATLQDSRNSWFESFKEIQESASKTADSISSAMQTIANGEKISNSDFWEIMELDTDKIITDVKMVGSEYIINQEQLIKLKDQYIQKQIDSLKLDSDNLNTKRKELKLTLEQAKAELSLLGARGMANAEYREQFANAQATIKQGEANLKEYGAQIKRNNIQIKYWESRLGNTVDLTESLKKRQQELNDEIDKLNKDLENYQKAYEYIIDSRIANEEKELQALEDEKQVLQDELDILEKQKDTIEETIKNYETVNKLVQDTVNKEIDSLEEQKKAIEDTYNKRIEALKAENEEREDALDYAQKLANLENARNNKRFVRDETRGWRFESVKEDVVQAENEVKTFENNQAIKQLEKERDAETAIIDDIITSRKEYAELWQEMLDEIQTEEDEQLAQEILGADWREKIANGDIEVMEKFRSEYRNHNTALKTLTNTEIKLKQAAIEAKDAEIKAKQEQINKWKEFKEEVGNAMDSIKNAQSDYMDIVRELEEKEPLSLETREEALRRFSENAGGYLDVINQKQAELVNLQNDIGGDFEFNLSVNGLGDLQEAVEYVKQLGIEYNGVAIAKYLTENSQDIDKEDARNLLLAYADTSTNMRGYGFYSEGGVNDYTGLAMMHGSKVHTETIFNAPDGKKLYEYVHKTPDLVADMFAKVGKVTDFKIDNQPKPSVSIGSINVYANNPNEFVGKLDGILDKYFQNKLTENYTQR